MNIAKQTILFSMAVALAGCTTSADEQPAAVQPGKGAPVKVVATVGDGTTRAAATTSDSFTAFRMWGFASGGTLVNGADYSKSGTSSWTGSTIFWEEGATYQFFGISPYAEVTNASMTADEQSFNYTVPTDNAEQKDLLVSSLLAQQKTADNTLSLPFRHALTMLALQFTTATDLVFEIHSVTFCNLKNGGTFTFSSTTDCTSTPASTPVGTWTDNDATTTANYGVTLASDVTLTKDASPVTVIDKDGAQVIMVRPQSVTAWDKTGTVTEQTGGYVAVECKIHTTGGYYYSGSSATNYCTVYMPFGFNDMQMQKRYKLVYNMDGCLKANGSQVLSGVVVQPELTATVTEWDAVGGEWAINF